MSLGDRTIRSFTEALADGSPTPGGGAAAALAGATAAALAEMVCNVTLRDDDFADVHDELTERRDDLADLRATLTDLADEDAAAFEAVLEAYRRPSGDPDRPEAIEAAMTEAAEVPLRTAEACLAVVDHAATVAELGNQNAVTDAGAGALLGRAALEAALYNVDVNLGSLGDEATVEALRTRREALSAEAAAAVERLEVHLATVL
ncbi:MAG: cyclodeaminase/cyclohydrolase family protein [Halobacteriales archaeon]